MELHNLIMLLLLTLVLASPLAGAMNSTIDGDQNALIFKKKKKNEQKLLIENAINLVKKKRKHLPCLVAIMLYIELKEMLNQSAHTAENQEAQGDCDQQLAIEYLLP